jgi:hypothetical protein
MNLYKIYAIKINERTGSKYDVPEFVVAISVTEAEDKFRKSWKGWKIEVYKNITYAIDIII